MQSQIHTSCTRDYKVEQILFYEFDVQVTVHCDKFLYRTRHKNLTVFKSRYIGNRVGWSKATKVNG